MKTVIIVQARMTSTRLPGKILKEVLGKPLLEYQIERLRRIKNADEIVIATTTNDTDQPVVDLCEQLSVAYFRGSEEDVLARYYGTAVKFQADIVVRITSDCPLIDPAVCDEGIRWFLQHLHKCDYLRLEKCPRGLDIEICPFKVLEECFREAAEQPDREHVTTFIYKRHPERYRIKYLNFIEDLSHHRWTVDTPEDFELIKRIIEQLYPVKSEFNFVDILDVMEKNPEWHYINAEIQQKRYGE
ncbi:acylneuraminate cytidylyltransferase [Lucifera butyrica]|uniref:Acylneuraminate cytidylyltransferase n=1 Tax=Lucifera butyrica TaxID=1351585 RepID=A0A498R3V2_9FIRM|nr:glycosyltransferase family protein [Lucifera butyrica]VBB05527.1 acylneuraminate cytidylyltransferase [Lucifera butyrica]